ncbi:MAG TPA: hypothetical protein VFB45_21525 [Pseudolabrys sp.]|nr:hypothetical protein [Pseudolabrys sp.]
MPARLAIARFALALPVALMALMLAILAIIVAKPARSAQLDPAGCTRNLTETTAKLAALKVELKGTATGKRCTVTRLYFLEAVKARAVTALCKSGPDRIRELERLDADVETINQAIAACE